MWRVVGVAVATVALAALLGFASDLPVPWHEDGMGELRFSLGARPERIETCHRLSDEELASRPAHMRRRVECEGRSATYLLTVILDEAMLDSVVVTGGGLREDRPIFLLRRHPVAPGLHRLQVRLTRREPVDTATPGAGGEPVPVDEREAREARQRLGWRERALPAALGLDRTVMVRPGAALLVTVDGDSLALHGPAGHADADAVR